MSTETHPLISHLNATGESLTSFAKRTSLSRTHLYRIMNGEATTTTSLWKISDATGGKVPVTAFIPRSRSVAVPKKERAV